jgi:filamentous hemagglutinin
MMKAPKPIKNATLLSELIINGERGYEFDADGQMRKLSFADSVTLIRNSENTNAAVYETKGYIRLRKGQLQTKTINTTLINRNGLSFISPTANVIIPVEKITKYLLSKEHPVGKHKAVLYEKVLGITLDNYTELLTILRDGVKKHPVTNETPTEHGIKYNIDIPVFRNNRNAIILSAWIEVNEGKIRLATAYIK